MRKTLQAFAAELPKWYVRYMERNEYAWGYIELMDRLPQKAEVLDCLDKEDLIAIAVWGGNQRNIREVIENLDGEHIRLKTREALHCSDDRQGLRAITSIAKGWGISYGSKTLMFMDPLKYGILDDKWMRNCFCPPLPHTEPGFLDFLKQLRKVRTLCHSMEVQGLGPDGHWRIADVQQALFQYAQEGGKIV